MQRRTLLRLGIASGALLALAGGGAALLRSAPGWRDGRLMPAGRRVMRAVARGVLDGLLPQGANQHAVLEAHLERVNATVAALSPSTQAELDRLLTLLATAPGRIGLAGLTADWDQAQTAQLQQALESMRRSSLALRLQAYHALRELTQGAHFADASSWPLLGYPGPRGLA
jgi:hypothetical protein